ncbi:ABC transporter permease [Cocleimonas flava]|uniref:Arginine/ornithine transport system permease protein n=1 Tax=Cocleimonas flava TaxID=634765 RepID=A0A4R1EYD7_9GAMM|nr:MULTISPECIES: ABC transporter permease [Cocleimonas]MEB8433390.1 ABC transporter permease [Cocleimonas sp. KMM 6892]MEC4716201.1 ABC transporter permease [Cocleimonas sp. KMM 6895]MEC4745906.1 ABC transporter permease [Cocleimonas sp. KMM 6896]TCJ85034.1 arginine/ornithine transport system permease protein [Cocleimonas flava]
MTEIFGGYLPMILKGMVVTVEVALLSLILSLALGILAASARLYGGPIAKAIAGTYTTVIRGIPDLVLMMLIFFGGQVLVNKVGDKFGWGYIDIDPFIAGILTIGFIFGAYMGETFRGAIMAVSKGEIEAGHAYGMTSFQVFTHITFPGMIRHAIPGFFNNWLVLVKTTALVSVIGLEDMVFNAKVAGDTLRQPFTFYVLVGVLFLLITAISDLAMKWLERRYKIGGH